MRGALMRMHPAKRARGMCTDASRWREPCLCSQRVKGMLADRISRGSGSTPIVFCMGAGDETTDLDKRPVLDLMTPLTDVVSVDPSASVSECVDIFFNKNVRHIPVRDSAGTLGFARMRTPTALRRVHPVHTTAPGILFRHEARVYCPNAGF